MQRRKMALAVSVTASVVAALMVGPLSSGAAAAPRNAVTTCGQVITVDSVLTRDLACPDDGVVIAGENVTLRLDGHTVTSATGTGTGVRVDAPTGSWRVLGPGRVSSFQYGVFVGPTSPAGTLEVRRVTFTDNEWVSQTTAEAATYESVTATGPNGFHTGGAGPLVVRRSSITASVQQLAVYVGLVRVERSRLTGGRIDLGSADLSLTENRITDLGIDCTQGVLDAIGNRLVDSTVELLQCQGSSLNGNTFRAGSSPATPVALNLTDLDPGPWGTTFVAGNSFTGYGTGITMRNSVSDTIITGNTFKANGAGIVQYPNPHFPPSDGTLSGNTFIRNTGDGLELRSGTWHVGANTAIRNGGLGLDLAPDGGEQPLVIIDDGGNTAIRNAEPQCVGIVCGPPAP